MHLHLGFSVLYTDHQTAHQNRQHANVHVNPTVVICRYLHLKIILKRRRGIQSASASLAEGPAFPVQRLVESQTSFVASFHRFRSAVGTTLAFRAVKVERL